MILITTTVAVDAQKTGAQVTLHLIQGDAGTRRILFVPVSGGRQVDISGAARAYVRALSLAAEEPLLIPCTIEDGNAYMVPTAALVANADEWACELIFMDDEEEPIEDYIGRKLTSLPFTIITHGSVYDGDAVEHTNNSVSAVYFDEQGRLVVELLDGSKIIAPKWEHTHPLATAEEPGFMSPSQFTLLQQLSEWMDQGVKTTDSPTFAGLRVGDLVINGDGTIEGLRFT